ncbi:flotillin family protein [bacterium]|nr:flotillin family protein [bacterium]
MIYALVAISVLFLAVLTLGVIAFIAKFIVKAEQGRALIITSRGATKVSFTADYVIPIFQRLELMDISLKRIEIERSGKDGLICKDNIRADIKVAFFVRVNKTVEDVLKVAQSIGCQRASDPRALIELFDAKFSEGLKTVGKRFDFTQLYTDRGEFKTEILEVIGTDLNGFILDDAAIDYLEQTPVTYLSPQNILDAEGIKKITDLTANQAILSNKIDRDREKTITKQNVEAREAILEMERQLAESEEKQRREVAAAKAREQAESVKIQQEEKLKAERARITTEEEVRIAEEQKERQIIVAQKAKERTEKIEIERVEKDRALEATERERIVSLAQIEKEKAIETERKTIQEVIRERVSVEKAVVAEEEKIRDTKVHAEAERGRHVKVVAAEANAQELLVKQVQAADASRQSAELDARRKVIEAEAEFSASEKRAQAMKIIAEAKAAEEAVIGMSEVTVMQARAKAVEEQGAAEAKVLELKAFAEARGLEARANAKQKEGEAEATVLGKKLAAEAQGITEKAEAMRKLDGVGKEHEEYKLRLDMEKSVALAQISIQKDIAAAQAEVISSAVKSAKIDIVGGETMFFEKIIGSIAQGKSIDRLVDNSQVLTDVKETFFTGDGDQFSRELRRVIGMFGVNSEDVKNLTVSALIADLMTSTEDEGIRGKLQSALAVAKRLGLAGKTVASVTKL